MDEEQVKKAHKIIDNLRDGEWWTIRCRCGWEDDESLTKSESRSEHALHLNFKLLEAFEAAHPDCTAEERIAYWESFYAKPVEASGA